MISLAAWETRDKWLDGSSMVVAFMRLAAIPGQVDGLVIAGTHPGRLGSHTALTVRPL